jgi:hypothetical protein
MEAVEDVKTMSMRVHKEIEYSKTERADPDNVLK